MGGHYPTRRLLVAVTTVLLLAGCSNAASPTLSPTTSPIPALATPAAAATPATAATATPSPQTTAATATPSPQTTAPAIAYGPVTVTAGSFDCETTAGSETTDPQGVTHFRGGTFDCVDVMNDPRVSGRSVWGINFDAWGNMAKGAIVQWGPVRVSNAKGEWVGTYTGVWDNAHGDTLVAWYAGTGAYAGLTYFELATGNGPWQIQGEIYPGTPPKP